MRKREERILWLLSRHKRCMKKASRSRRGLMRDPGRSHEGGRIMTLPPQCLSFLSLFLPSFLPALSLSLSLPEDTPPSLTTLSTSMSFCFSFCFAFFLAPPLRPFFPPRTKPVIAHHSVPPHRKLATSFPRRQQTPPPGKTSHSTR